MSLTPADLAKRAAAAQALDMVEDGMMLGLGSGSTAAWFVRLLAESGRKVTGVPTSSGTARLAAELGIPLVSLEQAGRLDLTVDGADEFDPALNLTKGGGAALLQEKIVATASDRLVIITDASKRVARLGAFPLPVEIVRFGWPVTQAAIAAGLERIGLGGRVISPRMAGDAPLVTDEGHHIVDLHLVEIPDVPALAALLDGIPGVVEHGLFVGMADCVILARPDGTAEQLHRLGTAPRGLVDVDAEMRDEDA